MTGLKDDISTASSKIAYLTMPNMVNSVALEKTVIDSSSLAECANHDDPQVIENRTPGFKHYSRSNCQMMGLQRAALSFQKCALQGLPNIGNAVECSPYQGVQLMKQMNAVPNRGTIFDAGCPLNCIQEDFKARITSKQITQGIKGIRKALSQNGLGGNVNETIDEDVIVLTVHYPSFDYIQTIQHPMVRHPNTGGKHFGFFSFFKNFLSHQRGR